MNLGVVLLTGLFAGGISRAAAQGSLLIDETVEDLAGVARAKTSVRAGRTTVDLYPDEVKDEVEPEEIIPAIQAAGYGARSERT